MTVLIQSALSLLLANREQLLRQALSQNPSVARYEREGPVYHDRHPLIHHTREYIATLTRYCDEMEQALYHMETPTTGTVSISPEEMDRVKNAGLLLNYTETPKEYTDG